MLLCFLLFGVTLPLLAKVQLHYSLGLDSESWGEDRFPTEISGQKNEFFLGVAFGPGHRFVLGQNIYLASRTIKREYLNDEVELELSRTELGPKLLFFLNGGRNFYLSFAYHFSVKGARKFNEDDELSISGDAMLLSFGMQMPLTRSLFFGLSFNHHTLNINKSTLAGVESTENDSYKNFYPALQLSYRWGGGRNARYRSSFPGSWRGTGN